MTAIHLSPKTTASTFIQNNPVPKAEDLSSSKKITQTLANVQNQEPEKLEGEFHQLFQKIKNQGNRDIINSLKAIDLDGQHHYLSDDDIEKLFTLAEDFGKALDKGATKEEIEKITKKIQAFGLNGSFALAAVGHILGMFYRTGDRKDMGSILTHVFLDHLAQEGAFQGTKLSDDPKECFKQMRKLLEKKIELKFLTNVIGDSFMSLDSSFSSHGLSHDEAKVFRQNLIESMRMPLANAKLAQNPKKFEKMWVNSFREMMTNAIAQAASGDRKIENMDKKFSTIVKAMKNRDAGQSFLASAKEEIKKFNKACIEQGYSKDDIKDIHFYDFFKRCEHYLQALDEGETMRAKKIAKYLEEHYKLSGVFALNYIISLPMTSPSDIVHFQPSIGPILASIFDDYVAKLWPTLNSDQVKERLEKLVKGMGYKDMDAYIKEMDSKTKKLKSIFDDLEDTREVSGDKQIHVLRQLMSIFSKPIESQERNAAAKHYLKSA